MERERQRIDGGRDEVGADPRRDEGVGERRAACGLHEEADGQAARLAEALDEVLRDVREQCPRWIVEEHTRRAELAKPPRLLHERVRLAGAARAVDEPDVELAARADDRFPGLTQVRDVVQGVVEPEDHDPVLGSAGDEAADDVG